MEGHWVIDFEGMSDCSVELSFALRRCGCCILPSLLSSILPFCQFAISLFCQGSFLPFASPNLQCCCFGHSAIYSFLPFSPSAFLPFCHPASSTRRCSRPWRSWRPFRRRCGRGCPSPGPDRSRAESSRKLLEARQVTIGDEGKEGWGGQGGRGRAVLSHFWEGGNGCWKKVSKHIVGVTPSGNDVIMSVSVSVSVLVS